MHCVQYGRARAPCLILLTRQQISYLGNEEVLLFIIRYSGRLGTALLWPSAMPRY